MEQRRDAPSGTAPDSVAEEAPSFVERHFWPILAGIVLVFAGAGATVVALQYSQVDRALRSVPYVDRAGQLAASLPYVGGPDTSSTDDPQTYGSFTRMKGLVVNPAGSAGGRYLAVSLAFESKSARVENELENKKVVVKDAVLGLLSEQTVEELSDPDHREELKEGLLKETNRILSTGTVDRLYFTEFVLQ